MTAQEQTDRRMTTAQIVERIRDRVAELLEPTTTVTTAWVRAHVGPCPAPACAACGRVEAEHGVPWRCRGFVRVPVYGWQDRCVLCGQAIASGTGQRLEPRSHTVVHPALVDQLEDQVEASTAGASGSGAESKPAANIAAVDSLGIMEREAAIWVRVLTGAPGGLLDEVPASDSVRDLLLLLVERAATLEAGQLRDLDFDVLRWWARARVVTTWDVEPIKVHVPCMNCERRGGIQVRLDPTTAVCLHCGAAWDQATIGILGEYIRLAMDAEPVRHEAPDGVWPAPAAGDEHGHGVDDWTCACHGAKHFPARLAAACERRSGWTATA